MELSAGADLYIPYYYLGRMDVQRGNLVEACAWFEKAIILRPDHATPRIMLGCVLADLGELDAAETAHRSATACTGGGCIDEAFFNLGLILRAKQRYAEAFECFERAIQLDPHYSLAIAAREDVAGVLLELESSS
jgi:Flp pilus assembly protein TadD